MDRSESNPQSASGRAGSNGQQQQRRVPLSAPASQDTRRPPPHHDPLKVSPQPAQTASPGTLPPHGVLKVSPRPTHQARPGTRLPHDFLKVLPQPTQTASPSKFERARSAAIAQLRTALKTLDDLKESQQKPSPTQRKRLDAARKEVKKSIASGEAFLKVHPFVNPRSDPQEMEMGRAPRDRDRNTLD